MDKFDLADCPACGMEMKHIHEHDECWSCGLVIGCCEGFDMYPYERESPDA